MQVNEEKFLRPPLRCYIHSYTGINHRAGTGLFMPPNIPHKIIYPLEFPLKPVDKHISMSYNHGISCKHINKEEIYAYHVKY